MSGAIPYHPTKAAAFQPCRALNSGAKKRPRWDVEFSDGANVAIRQETTRLAPLSVFSEKASCRTLYFGPAHRLENNGTQSLDGI
jgi:hypothetical protein